MSFSRHVAQKFVFPLVSFFLVFLLLSNSSAQDLVPPESFSVADGLEVQVWATTPDLRNPTNIDVDANGQVWVTEGVNYRTFGNDISVKYEEGDRVIVLSDENNDGKADAKQEFYQTKDFVSPLGVTVMGDRVFVASSPTLWEFRDQNGNDTFDPDTDTKREFLTGFGGLDHDHGLHEVSAGPGGRLYFNAGNAGPHIVEDRGGWTLRAGSWYNGGTPHMGDNEPGLKSDDGRVWVGGVALRMDQDGTNMRPIGHNFRNSYDQTPTSFGNVFQNDNDDDGDDSCRTSWLMRYGAAGYSSLDGKRHWRQSQQPGLSTQKAHWRQKTPGIMPAGDIYGHGAPTGITIYENGPLPEKYRGTVLSADSTLGRVFAYQPQKKGAGYSMDQRIDFINSREAKEGDRDHWFRPSDVAIGPSGAVYVADWFDPGVGGHNMRDDKARGTIYRIVPEGTNPQPPSVNTGSIKGQIKLLKNPAQNVRILGFNKLVKQGEDAVPAVKDVLKHDNSYIAARAVWVLAHLGSTGKQTIVNDVLTHSSPRMRVAGYRALDQVISQKDLMEYAETLADDASPAVRRTVALSLRDVPFDQKKEILLELYSQYEAHDRWYLEALGTAVEGDEETFYTLVRNKFNPGSPLTWSEEFADLAWRLHPPVSVASLFRRANAEQIPNEERKRAVVALSFVETKQAAEAVARLAGQGPQQIRPYAGWWLDHRTSNKWSDYDVSAQEGDEGLFTIAGVNIPTPPISKTEQLTSENPVTEMSVDIQGSNRIYLVTTDAGDGNTADWTNWINPVVETADGQVIDLTERNWEKAHSGWKKPRKNKNVTGDTLQVDGQSYDRGIGIHAPSVIVYDLSDVNAVEFRATVGLDRGGVKQNSGATVHFQVHGSGKQIRRNLQVLRDSDSSMQEKQKAAISLAQSSEGGKALLNMAKEGEIPEEIRKKVARFIHQNPSDEVRSKAGEYFPLLAGRGDLPGIEKMASMDADPANGKKLFYGKAGCNVCHSINGKGGNVGPDLSAIGLKFGRNMMLDAMINPSAGISFGYHAETVQTKGGNTITGIVMPTSQGIIVRDAAGNTHEFSSDEIKNRKKLDRSLMPSAANLNLSAQELVDVASFLQKQKGNGE